MNHHSFSHFFAIRSLQKQLILAGLFSLALPVTAAENNDANLIITAPIVVTGTRVEHNSFDLPMSIDVTDAKSIQDGQLKVNLSESAARIPGVVVNNRNNPAQDLAIQVRGFGARSAFGVRGVRLYADGIPMTMPDGQGQTGTFNLDTADRIEYLRGPFSALYGNSSGGVVQIFTQDGPKDPTLSAGFSIGSYGTRRESVTFGDSGEGFDYIVNGSTYRSDGYRDHSYARRDTVHGKLNFKLSDDTKLTIVATALDQPDNLDPQGLNADDLRANRTKAGTDAVKFNTRVSKSQQQAGATLEHHFSANDTLRLMTYYGERKNEQYLSISTVAQKEATSGGGVAVIDRSFGGVDARWTHKGNVADKPFNFTVGINYDLMSDDRTGYENFIKTSESSYIYGVKGNLRRNENNTVTSFDQYAQASIDLMPRWSVTGGMRNSRVSFKTTDRYIVTDNGDDSGAVNFSQTTPVIGTIFKATESLNLYANAGKSFETPTFVEMAYKSVGSGLNLDLKPAISNQYEVGAKWALGAATLINAAVFLINTDDEIVVQQSSGGRTVFQNVKSSERKGFELSFNSYLGRGVKTYMAYTYLDAAFSSDFTSCKPFITGQFTCVPQVGNGNGHTEIIKSGADIPGTYKQMLYGEVSWRYEPLGFSAAVEERIFSSTNVAFKAADGKASGYALTAVRAGFTQKVGNWKFGEFARVDNLLDKEYVGSVRVGDLNSRYYEAAPGRNWLIGLNASYKF